LVLSCMRGPRLYRVISDGRVVDYQPGVCESYGDTILTSLSCAASLAKYTAPLVLPLAYRRGWLTEEGGLLIGKFLFGVGIAVCGAIFLRTLGRLSSPLYTQFISVLGQARANYTKEARQNLERYDFQFGPWPVDFDVRQLEGDGSKPVLPSSARSKGPWGITDLVAWLLTHSFGISLVYPGSMGIMGMLVEKPLLEGRTKLLQEDGGKRHKVVTSDGNEIDTMFVQQKTNEHGGTLVICCEGNAGFYEIGMMATAMSAGYSVLGWNHPGFAGSTGRPYPDQELAAADAVMQFAIHKLGYKLEDILVYGWSIGGFTSSYLAMTYPEVQGLLLDATFDHVEPLALPRMPQAMSGLVSTAVNKFICLNVAEQVAKFPGPLRLIRRNRDEMISTVEGELWSNRGNNLLESVLSSRYPGLVTPDSRVALHSLLYSPGALRAAGDKGEEAYTALLEAEGGHLGPTSGKSLSHEEQALILGYLASKLMTEVDTTHCTPLPTSQFLKPWVP